MKNNIRYPVLLFIFIASQFLAQSQNISISPNGSQPDNSAMLDVSDTTRGILIPRMTLVQRNLIVNPAAGLLLYQTDNSAGFYYNSGAAGAPVWIKLITATSLQTSLQDADGNTRIEVEQGPNDDIIRFIQNGTEFLQIDSGLIRLKNTLGNIYIGDGAGTKPYLSTNNIGMGFGSLSSSTNGRDNVAIGAQTMVSGTGAAHRENVAIGTQALQSGLSSYGNVAIGMRALNVNSGLFNVAIGRDATRINTGSYNTSIGQESGFLNVSGNSNVFLGNQAGYNELGSDKLYIENTNSAFPLIYGDFANDSIRINGLLMLDSAKNGTGYTFPGLDGTVGQTLTTNGSGKLTWANAASSTIWTLAGQILYPSSINNKLVVGGTAIEPNYRMQVDAGAASITKGLYIKNTANAGANDKIGIEIFLDQASSKRKYGIINRIIGTPNQADSLIGVHNILSPDNNASLPVAIGFRSSYIGTDGQTYGIWAEGEKYNYFNGNLGLGIKIPSAKLDVYTDVDYPTIDLNQGTNTLLSSIRFKFAGTASWRIGGVGPSNVDGPGFEVYNYIRTNTDLFVDGDNGNVGVNTKTPEGTLSINGTLQYKISTLNVGTNDILVDVAIPSDGLVLRLTGPDSNADLTGITESFDGRVIELINTTTFDIRIMNDDLNSLAPNRIYTRNGGIKTLRPFSSVRLIYSSIDTHWIILGGTAN